MKYLFALIFFIFISTESFSQIKSPLNNKVGVAEKISFERLKPISVDTRSYNMDLLVFSCRPTIYMTCERIFIAPPIICSKNITSHGKINSYFDLLKYIEPDQHSFEFCKNFALSQLRYNYYN